MNSITRPCGGFKEMVVVAPGIGVGENRFEDRAEWYLAEPLKNNFV